MIKTLKKHGNSQALVIDRSMMEALGINEDTPLQVSVRDGSLVVTPAEVGIEPEQFEASLNKVMRRYDGMLKRLAQ
ncbi:AbrB/MazE/SpoVT family DNA-binding domain-containing protein [Phycisphaerales bacterium AB-hyl4]|uniref:AbrB/MazE/SpoVT family DNA-binding domain-containing protein n=1 Tax=Natronomicrosphaera hydrolytica TaxID=3242702 RepID=A0ABV4U6L2_9BACT